ncbi:hypothetical protein PMZ84_11320 [[Clostridium] symbiosum]|jgi:hypothetical protein|uniref:hypothetical protein n=1 Tax=Clostridium symbiosum TaxID=1512 RepID=UPI001921C5D2|nr:hypothetical protein [[Clostridium] symbiosum]MDB2031806.1 hypothetical protein [[Clostridium] symbiosum]
MKKDLSDLSIEVEGISLAITGLINQLDNKTNSLTGDSLGKALFGISCHLDRISDDLSDMI